MKGFSVEAGGLITTINRRMHVKTKAVLLTVLALIVAATVQ